MRTGEGRGYGKERMKRGKGRVQRRIRIENEDKGTLFKSFGWKILQTSSVVPQSTFSTVYNMYNSRGLDNGWRPAKSIMLGGGLLSSPEICAKNCIKGLAKILTKQAWRPCRACVSYPTAFFSIGFANNYKKNSDTALLMITQNNLFLPVHGVNRTYTVALLCTNAPLNQLHH